jgi:hypothetical protein
MRTALPRKLEYAKAFRYIEPGTSRAVADQVGEDAVPLK